jgi:hypothetical protein
MEAVADAVGREYMHLLTVTELMGDLAAMVREALCNRSNNLGGAAGHGSNGADGGRGGEVTILVKDADMDILMALIQPSVKGGMGGQKGNHGIAGSGGLGGEGSAPYTWYRYHSSH